MAEKSDTTARLRRAVKGALSSWSTSFDITSHMTPENNLFLVKRLIRKTDMRNPDPTQKRYTSLAWAAVLGHEETFEFLLSAGHDDEELSKVRVGIAIFIHFLNSGFQDTENNTVLMLLADLKPPSPNPYSPAQADSDIMGAGLRMARMYHDRYSWILDWSNTQGRTALHLASLKGNEELVRVCCILLGNHAPSYAFVDAM
jgi:ankyrin repeat protein